MPFHATPRLDGRSARPVQRAPVVTRALLAQPTPANEKEYEPLADLLTGTPAEVVIADKGLWGRGYQARLAADDVRLLTPDRTRTAANIGRERALASLRPWEATAPRSPTTRPTQPTADWPPAPLPA
jgi:hypothetical protein